MCLVYEVTHKKMDMYQGEGYKPLFVGAYNKEIPMGYYGDNIGENISKKNDSYCELTGLYWIWKNSKKQFVGLVHYRRFFGEYLKGIKIRQHYLTLSKKKAWRIYDINELIEMLGNNDLLVKKEISKCATIELFKSMIGGAVCDDVCMALERLSPEYIDVFQEEMQGYSHFNCNMFFGKKEIIDRYCEWLFPLLEEVEKIYFCRNMQKYHNREIGYIGEMLFKTWIRYNNVEYKVISVVSFAELCNPWEYLLLAFDTFKLWRKNVFIEGKMQKNN